MDYLDYHIYKSNKYHNKYNNLLAQRQGGGMHMLTRARNRPNDILDEIQINLIDQQSPVNITKEELKNRQRGVYKKISNIKTIENLKDFIRNSNWPQFKNYSGDIHKRLYLLLPNSNKELESTKSIREVCPNKVCQLDLYNETTIYKQITITNYVTRQNDKVPIKRTRLHTVDGTIGKLIEILVSKGLIPKYIWENMRDRIIVTKSYPGSNSSPHLSIFKSIGDSNHIWVTYPTEANLQEEEEERRQSAIARKKQMDLEIIREEEISKVSRKVNILFIDNPIVNVRDRPTRPIRIGDRILPLFSSDYNYNFTKTLRENISPKPREREYLIGDNIVWDETRNANLSLQKITKHLDDDEKKEEVIEAIFKNNSDYQKYYGRESEAREFTRIGWKEWWYMMMESNSQATEEGLHIYYRILDNNGHNRNAEIREIGLDGFLNYSDSVANTTQKPTKNEIENILPYGFTIYITKIPPSNKNTLF